MSATYLQYGEHRLHYDDSVYYILDTSRASTEDLRFQTGDRIVRYYNEHSVYWVPAEEIWTNRRILHNEIVLRLRPEEPVKRFPPWVSLPVLIIASVIGWTIIAAIIDWYFTHKP